MSPVLVDISRLFYRRLTGRRPTGIDRVSLEYLRHYAGRAHAVLGVGPFVSILSAPESEAALQGLRGESRSLPGSARLVLSAYLRWWTRPEVAGSVLLNTSHTGLEKSAYASSLRRRGARPVFFVHDLIPITHPEYCRPGERDRHIDRIRTAATAGHGIIVPSRYTLDTLTRHCGDAGLSLPPAVVAPLASALPAFEPGPRPLAEPYFVVVGTIEPRKNLALLLRVWQRLSARAGGAIPRLVVIGHRGWESAEVIALLDRSAAPGGAVVELGPCGDRELVTWLRHAQALLFPSFVEGYGLPLAEALALGVPVIAADLPVFREVAGEVPEYAAPLDDDRWLALVTDYSRPGDGRRSAQQARMAGFRATTWAQHFSAVDAFLDRL